MSRCTLLVSAVVGVLAVSSWSPWGPLPAARADEAQVYAHLVVVVPGEQFDAASPDGRTGQPLAQRVGVPFRISVRACSAEGGRHHGINQLIGFTSSDAAAELPIATPLFEGELTAWATLNDVGSFTITAADQAAPQQFFAVSSPIPVETVAPPPTCLAISPIAANQVAGQPLLVTIEARRANGTRNQEIHGPVALHQVTAFGPGVVSPASVTLVNGVWSGIVTFYLAAPRDTDHRAMELLAEMAEPSLQGVSNPFEVAPGAYARLLVVAPGQIWTPWIIEGMSGMPRQQWCDRPYDVEVFATDEYWNRVDAAAAVRLESGDAAANTPQYARLAEGTRTFTVAMRTPGNWFLAVGDLERPEIGGMVSLAVPVYYSHLQILLPGQDPAPGTATGVTGAPRAQVAGVPFPVRIRACNDDYQPVPTDRVVVRVSSTDDTATLPAAQPLHDGELATTVTFNAAGTFTVTAQDINGPGYYVVTSDDVVATGSTGIATAIAIDGLDAAHAAGTPVVVTIRAVDAVGDQVHRFAGEAALAQLAASDTLDCVPARVTLDDGAWTGPITFRLADAASRLRATAVADSRLRGVSDAFTVAPGVLARLLLVVPGQHPAPAGEDGLTGWPAPQAAGRAFGAEVFATDAWWNRVAVDHVVRLTSSSSPPTEATLDDGHAVVPVTFAAMGAWTLTANDLTDPLVTPMTSLPISVLGSAPDFAIDPITSPVTAGEPVAVTIRCLTPQGTLLEGYDGYAMLAADTGPATVSPALIQFAGGVWSGDVTFFGASAAMAFSCVDFSTPPNVGSSQPFVVSPGAYAGLQVLLPGQRPVGGRDPGFAGAPASQAAGVAFAAVVQAVDAWWNPVHGVASSIDLGITDPFAQIAGPTALDDGRLEVSITALRAGDHTVAVGTADAGIEGHTSSVVTVVPGSYARLLALAPGEELLAGSERGKAGLALDQSIRHPFAVRVLATDRWWNPVRGVDDALAIECTDALADVPATLMLADGTAEFPLQLATAGYQLLTFTNVSDPDIDEAHTQMRAIESGFHIEAEVHPAQVVAGQPFTLTVRVVNDAGAVMQDINGVADIVARHAVTQAPGAGELLVSSLQLRQGTRSITETYTRSEPIVLVVTSPLGEAPGLTGVVTVVAGAPASLEFHQTTHWVGGRRTADINARVADALDNGVSGTPVSFQLAGSSGILEALDEVTDAAGVAHARYTAGDHAATDVIQVHAGGLATAMEIVTSLMDPAADGGALGNYPNPFHPDDGATTIIYMLSRAADVTMRFFTLGGNLVLRREFAADGEGGRAGVNQVGWDGRNGDGEVVASGGYILDLEARSNGETIHQSRCRIGVVR